ncbi:MAG: HAMP domain-containing protein [Acidobacteria bacterium]|nr:HAMP domain-containing protein [Acidobacteriota bacterium]
MRRRSAVFELTAVTVFIVAAVLGMLTWLSLRWQRTWQLNEVERGLLLTSDALLSSLRQDMLLNRREDLRRAIGSIPQGTRIERVRLIEHRGRITTSTDPKDEGGRLARSAAGCAICHNGGGRARIVRAGASMRAFTPVLAEAGCINAACHQQESKSRVLGVIELDLSLEDVEKDLARNQAALAVLSAGTALAAGGLLGFALMRRLRRPLRDLLGGIRRVAAGELSHRIPERSRDEFGEVAQSFNAMSRQLSQIQQSLIRSERLISMGKLAAGVAHEINNPLTGILSYAEDLHGAAAPGDPRREDYAVIVHEAMRCRQIVRNLLDFARQSAPALAAVDPRDAIDKAIGVLGRQAAFRRIGFEWRVEAGLPPVLADPVQIEQVLVNLMVNAQEAMPNGGVIVAGAELASGGRCVRFSVRDMGDGIPPEIRARIFDPFFSTKGGKTDGLGLAVCLGIVQQHGGTIDFQSEVGRGTVFQVSLPVFEEGRSDA